MSEPKSHTPRTVWIAVAFFAVAVAAYYPYSPGGRQARHMLEAERYITKLKPAVKADPRFNRVDLEVQTSHDGSLGVSGDVATEADRDALRTLVLEGRPPVEVVFRVAVDAAAATRPQQ